MLYICFLNVRWLWLFGVWWRDGVESRFLMSLLLENDFLGLNWRLLGLLLHGRFGDIRTRKFLKEIQLEYTKIPFLILLFFILLLGLIIELPILILIGMIGWFVPCKLYIFLLLSSISLECVFIIYTTVLKKMVIKKSYMQSSLIAIGN
uniref:NADH:quinone oxidoreductase/Mrp antiporter membrane subunit domain-containing protein n=1 Tax=Lactuca sativa TaxID=4236 RepID=A0A9R1X5L3_LACSA|nr:hypothetical protein LSAT_V11C600305340 [Lactuca sativa]